MIEKIPRLYLIAGVVVLVIALTLGWWFYGTRIWNGVGNWLFHRQINAERQKVDKELAEAAEQKKVLEQTLLEYGQAKKELVMVKAEKDKLEQIFNDKSKTAQDKVAAFKAAAADNFLVTPTDGVTVDALCQRARSTNASAATISALCSGTMP